MANAAQQLSVHVPDPCEHVFYLSSAFGNRFVASLLASTQRLVFVCFTLYAILKAQCFKHLLPVLARIAFVSVDLPACVALVKHFVKVVAVMFAGCACRNTTDEAVLVIDADAELLAKVAFAMLWGVRGIQVLLPALGITPFGLLALCNLTAIILANMLHWRWHQSGINRLSPCGNETMAMQLGIHTMQQRSSSILANALSKSPNGISIRHIHRVLQQAKALAAHALQQLEFHLRIR